MRDGARGLTMMAVVDVGGLQPSYEERSSLPESGEVTFKSACDRVDACIFQAKHQAPSVERSSLPESGEVTPELVEDGCGPLPLQEYEQAAPIGVERMAPQCWRHCGTPFVNEQGEDRICIRQCCLSVGHPDHHRCIICARNRRPRRNRFCAGFALHGCMEGAVLRSYSVRSSLPESGEVTAESACAGGRVPLPSQENMQVASSGAQEAYFIALAATGADHRVVSMVIDSSQAAEQGPRRGCEERSSLPESGEVTLESVCSDVRGPLLSQEYVQAGQQLRQVPMSVRSSSDKYPDGLHMFVVERMKQ